ncbi:putative type VI secretion system effector, partial [Xenorhabdus szentirmaii]
EEIKIKNRSFSNGRITKEECDQAVEEATNAIEALTAKLNAAPPQPELPPQRPLFKIEGTVEKLEIQYIKNYFDDRAYSTDNYERDRKIEMGGGGILVLLGDFMGGAFINKSERRELNDSDFVQGKINGKRFYGWLGKTVIKENDYVEMVVMEKDDCYVVYAITLPEKRILMMTPQCMHGRYLALLEGAMGAFFLCLVAIFFMALFMIGSERYLEKILYLITIAYPMVLFPLYLLYVTVYLVKPKPTTKLAEEIFMALGMKNYKSRNLEYKSIKIYNKLKIDKLSEEEQEQLPQGIPFKDSLYFY